MVVLVVDLGVTKSFNQTGLLEALVDFLEGKRLLVWGGTIGSVVIGAGEGVFGLTSILGLGETKVFGTTGVGLVLKPEVLHLCQNHQT